MKLAIRLKQIRLLVVLGSVLLAAGCATTSPEPSGGSASPALNDLDTWLAKELVPYLQSKMVGHPRFNNEPVAIVKLTDLRVDTRIDSLTNRLRGDLENLLIRDGGVSLIWQQSNANTCPSTEQANYLLGVETDIEQGEVTVNVRMLDVRENAWVPQFAFAYRGLSDPRVEALANQSVDDFWLKGTRVAPFMSADSDLAAESLARRFSCEVSRFSGKASVYMEPHNSAMPSFLKIQTLTGNYLQQQQNITLVEAAENADFTLRSEMVWVDQSLAQMWVKPIGKEREYLPNTAHIYLQNPITGANTTAPAPVVATESEVVSPQAVPSAAEAETQAILLDKFRVYVPSNHSLCESSDPFSSGRISLADEAELPSGTCFALSYAMFANSYAYLIHEGPDGQLSRLIPSNCDLVNEKAIQVGQNVWFPPKGKIMELDEETGIETFHLLAVDNVAASEDIRQMLKSLPSAINQCEQPKGITVRPQSSNGLLDQLRDRFSQIEWQTRRITHR